MEEKTSVELLKEFAKATRRSITVDEIPYPVSGMHKFQKFKRMIYMPNNSENTSFFIWFSDPYTKIGIPTYFCGAFIPISSRIKSEIGIRNRTVLDKLNVFSRSKASAMGNANFDSKVVISGEMDAPTKRFLSRSPIQSQLLKALEIELLMNISINQFNIDFVPEFKGKSYLSIINPQTWYFEKKEIEKVFSQIEKIRDVTE